MLDPNESRVIEQELAMVHDIEARMLHGKWTLSELLAMAPRLWDTHTRRRALYGWRAVAQIPVMLLKLADLQDAVDMGVLSPDAHLMALTKLGVFTGFRERYLEALEVVKRTLTDPTHETTNP